MLSVNGYTRQVFLHTWHGNFVDMAEDTQGQQHHIAASGNFAHAKSEETDKIIGLSVGADDYLTKPFSPRELVARVKAALRRIHAGGGLAEAAVLTFRHIRIDTGRRQVWLDDVPMSLTAVEFDLLKVLAEHRGLVLSREQLLEKVWGYDFYGEERVVDVHIGHIRQKLGGDQFIWASTVKNKRS